MADTSLIVSIAANTVLALPYVAKAWKRQVDVNAAVVTRLMAEVEELKKERDHYRDRIERLEERTRQLEDANGELERAKEAAETYAKQLEASERRAKALYNELFDLYTAVTGTHQGLSVRPLPPDWEELK